MTDYLAAEMTLRFLRGGARVRAVEPEREGYDSATLPLDEARTDSPRRAGRTASRVALPSGWPLVGWVSLVLVAMVAVLLAGYGTGEDGVRLVIRATARTSFMLFILAFVASALRRAWRSPVSAWLLANRRYLGVSFAVSHLLHLLAIVALYDWSLRRFVTESGAPILIVGGIGYLFVIAMAATSFDRTAAWLGPRRWHRLHTVGMYWLWGVFTISYVPRALIEGAAYAPLALATLGALALRVIYRPRRRRALAA